MMGAHSPVTEREIRFAPIDARVHSLEPEDIDWRVFSAWQRYQQSGGGLLPEKTVVKAG